MLESSQPTAAATLQGLNQALINAFIKKDEALASLKEAEATITAIRNNLGGVQIGQKLQDEVNAEKLAALETDRKAKSPNQAVAEAIGRELHSVK